MSAQPSVARHTAVVQIAQVLGVALALSLAACARWRRLSRCVSAADFDAITTEMIGEMTWVELDTLEVEDAEEGQQIGMIWPLVAQLRVPPQPDRAWRWFAVAACPNCQSSVEGANVVHEATGYAPSQLAAANAADEAAHELLHHE